MEIENGSSSSMKNQTVSEGVTREQELAAEAVVA